MGESDNKIPLRANLAHLRIRVIIENSLQEWGWSDTLITLMLDCECGTPVTIRSKSDYRYMSWSEYRTIFTLIVDNDNRFSIRVNLAHSRVRVIVEL